MMPETDKQREYGTSDYAWKVVGPRLRRLFNRWWLRWDIQGSRKDSDELASRTFLAVVSKIEAGEIDAYSGRAFWQHLRVHAFQFSLNFSRSNSLEYSTRGGVIRYHLGDAHLGDAHLGDAHLGDVHLDDMHVNDVKVIPSVWRRDRFKFGSEKEFRRLIAELDDPVAEAVARHMRAGMSLQGIAEIVNVREVTARRKIQFVKGLAKIVREESRIDPSC